MNSDAASSDRIYEITAACIAVLVIGGAILVSVLSLLMHGILTDPPGWLQTAVGAVIGFYFARRSQAADRLSFLAAVEGAGAKPEQ